MTILPVLTAFLFCSAVVSSVAQTNPVGTVDQIAAALLERHRTLANKLSSNAYGRPLYLESIESPGTVTGKAYAVLNAPFSTVSTTFRKPNQWCDVMILHINTKYCRVVPGSNPALLKVYIGKKTPQALHDAFPLAFTMRQVDASAGLLVVQLNAEDGPMGTSNYSIELQAVPLDGNKTFIQLRYAYDYGLAGRLAMQAYMATAGRSKVGFSTATPAIANGQPSHVGGARGAAERNTMRYYLAIDAYLQALPLAPASQVNARLEKWFEATEQYPLQLKETDKASYLAMKKSEIARQQTAPSTP